MSDFFSKNGNYFEIFHCILERVHEFRKLVHEFFNFVPKPKEK
jgi:hypothetical protein